MQTILDLVGQLYNQNEAIRLNAEKELNIHHRLATSLYTGLDTALKLQGIPQLQYFTYLKHFIQVNYEQSANYIRKELREYLVSKIPSISQQIQPQFCQLLVFIIQKTLPDCEFIHQIIEYSEYDSTRIQLITIMLNTLTIKIKLSHSKFVNITQKMLLFYDLADVQKLELLVDLYRACTRQFYQLSEEIHGQIIVQFTQCLQFQPKQQEIIRKFCKAILKFNAQKTPDKDVLTLLYNSILFYLNNEIDRRVAYYILQLLQQILQGRQLIKEEEKIFLEFVFQKLIMLSQNEYHRQLTQTTDEEEDHLLMKLRKYGTEFLHFLLTYFNEEFILEKILSIRFDDSYIMKEARYFVISEIMGFVPAYRMDMLFVQELIMIVQSIDANLVPVKIQALKLLVRLQFKDLLNKNQIFHLIAIITQKIQESMLQPLFLCKMVDTLISFHKIQPLNSRVYQDLITLYGMQKTLIVKESILNCMVRIDDLGLGDQTLRNILIQEWQIGQNEAHQYKYQIKMVLNILEQINDTQIILTILQDCFRRKIHEQQCFQILNQLLRRLIQNKLLVTQFKQQLLEIHKTLICDPEYFDEVLQSHILLLIAEVAETDTVFDFIENFSRKLQSSDSLSLLSIMFSTIRGHETQIINYYCSMLKEMIYDGGKTYSELVCGLAILDIRGYDIKDLWMNIRRQIPSEQMLGILISKATIYVLSSNKYYVNYFKRLCNSLLNKHHLMYDMEYISLNAGVNHQISNALQSLDKQNFYDYRDVMKKIFETKFRQCFQICPELAKKFTIPEQSVDLDMQQLQIE